MGMRRWGVALAVLTWALTATGARADGEDKARMRPFPEIRCKLTLPDAGYHWIDHTGTPDAVAAMEGAAGVRLVLSVKDVPKGLALTEALTKDIDKGFIRPGVTTKMSGGMVTFRGLPCYQVHARFDQNGQIVTARFVVANSHAYVLVVGGSALPVEERAPLDAVFAAFDFLGAPQAPPAAPPPPKRVSAEQKAVSFSQRMGQVVGFCLMAIIALLVIRALLKRKPKHATPAPKPAAPEPKPPTQEPKP